MNNSIKISYDANGREYTTRRGLKPSSYSSLLSKIDVKKLLQILNINGYTTGKLKNGPGNCYRFICPFHNGESASCVIREGSKRFHCYGCGVSGTCIDLIKNLKDLSSLEAIQQARKWFPVSGLVYENYRIDIASMIDEVCHALQNILEEEKKDYAREYSRGVKRIWNERDHDKRGEYINELIDLGKEGPTSYQKANEIHIFQYLKSQNLDFFRLYLICKFFDLLGRQKRQLISELTYTGQIEDFMTFCVKQKNGEEYEDFYHRYFGKSFDEL